MKSLLNIFDISKKKKVPSSILENWFRIEYGKNWFHAYNHYVKTGSIHYKD